MLYFNFGQMISLKRVTFLFRTKQADFRVILLSGLYVSVFLLHHKLADKHRSAFWFGNFDFLEKVLFIKHSKLNAFSLPVPLPAKVKRKLQLL